MFARRSASDPTYRKSQASTGLPVQPSPVARGLCIAVIDCGDDPSARTAANASRAKPTATTAAARRARP